jgi:hypothetical protein
LTPVAIIDCALVPYPMYSAEPRRLAVGTLLRTFAACACAESR